LLGWIKFKIQTAIKEAMTQAYTTELTLEQYQLLESLLPPETATGRPRTVNMMSIIQGILYVLVSSCAWRLMPKEYPPYSTVYYYFSKWRDDGTWKRVHDRLVEWVRVAEDRDASPSVASVDSQTVPTAVMVSDSVGYDAGKKIKGRKRFTMVDTLGLLLMVKVVAADVQEREGAKQLLTKMNEERHRVPRLVRIWFDGGFSGPDFLHWVMDICHWIVDVVLRPNGSKGFVLLPKRWTVERTYGWLHWCRRLNVDYERLPASSEALLHIAMIRLMLRRLA
jgi:putative transposase